MEPELKELGIGLVAVSVDTVDGARVTQNTYEVDFPLLSDPDLQAHEAYHVVNALDDAGTEKLKSFGIDIETWSRRKHHKIAIPSMFLVDRAGIVRFAHAAHDYKTRPGTRSLLAHLRALQGDAGVAPGASGASGASGG